MLAGRLDRKPLVTVVAVRPQSNRWPVSYEPGPPPALLRGADCGLSTTELKPPRPWLAWTLCERIERAEIASALPVLAPERPASIVYWPGSQKEVAQAKVFLKGGVLP
eukprot:scaffold20169_cov69-Phaeocystis_antarctica.AAC.9